MKKWRNVLALCLLFPFLAHAACDKPIKFAGLDWESGSFITAILQIVASKAYDCPVESVPGAGVALENALAQNDIQVIAEVWAGRSPVLQSAIDAGKVQVVGDTLQGGAHQGWYIPKYVWEAHPNLRRYQDLAQFAPLFQQNGGKARFLNCPTGWTCEVFNTRLLHNTGLDKTFANVHPGVGAAMDAEISAAYEQHRPILFYYWQPTGLMAKYPFKALTFPPYDRTCWDDLLQANGKSDCISGFPVSPMAIAASQPFLRAHPELAAFFNRVQFTADQLNGAILAMQEHHRDGQTQAQRFLQQNPATWQKWLPAPAAEKLRAALQIAPPAPKSAFPQWSLESKLNHLLAEMVKAQGERFRAVSHAISLCLLHPLEWLLDQIPAQLLILAIAALAAHATRRTGFALFTLGSLELIGAFGLWAGLLQTVSLLTVAVFLTVLFGVPLGIFLAPRPRLNRILLPVLDVMQTMPSFVYLIPVLMLFGLGKVPALFATLIYAIAPLIRLTTLGMTQVPQGMIDAGLALGMTRWQLLCRVTLPLAKPSIMAGLNQTVMMSLSMVVLASMIGAPGLGEQVLQAIQTLNIGQGIQAGGAIVVLAIIIDRITQAYGQSPQNRPPLRQ